MVFPSLFVRPNAKELMLIILMSIDSKKVKCNCFIMLFILFINAFANYII